MRVKNDVASRTDSSARLVRCVRMIVMLIAIVAGSTASGQSTYQVLAKIDNLVQQTDSLAIKTQRTFYLNKIDKKFDGVKETWHYTMRDGKVVVFQVRYVLDSTEFTEIYYVNKGDLIYSEEYETIYYNETALQPDGIIWM